MKSNRQTVLVTGASGFIGRALCPALERAGWAVRRASTTQSGHGWLNVHPVRGRIDWREHLNGCEAVVHLAARTHITRGEVVNPDAVYQEVNAESTFHLAQAAATAGVSRFVFISSVKVNGEGKASAYQEDDVPSPQDSYGRSKWAAEQGLNAICGNTGLELVILRLPLVYGPFVRANFLRLMQWIDREIPLPFAAVQNRRSLLGIDNLTDAITTCLKQPAAAGRTYFVSDQQDVSTTELLELMACALGRKSRLWPMPRLLLEFTSITSIGSRTLRRLTDSLTVDSTRISSDLGWTPPNSLQAGLEAAARWFRSP